MTNNIINHLTMTFRTQCILNAIGEQITEIIQKANNNKDIPGYCIVMGNYSVIIPPQDRDSFWVELDELAGGRDLYFEVSQYDDLVMHTDQYEWEDFE